MGVEVEVICMNDRPVDVWLLRKAAQSIGLDFVPRDPNGRVPDLVFEPGAYHLRLPGVVGCLFLRVGDADRVDFEHIDEILEGLLGGLSAERLREVAAAQRRLRRTIVFRSMAGRADREIELMVLLAAAVAAEVEGYVTTNDTWPLEPNRAYTPAEARAVIGW